jgi:hypothetical protein
VNQFDWDRFSTYKIPHVLFRDTQFVAHDASCAGGMMHVLKKYVSERC